MKSNDLYAIFAVVVAFIAFICLITVGVTLQNNNETKQMTACVSAGGSWDSRYGDCIMPGVTLNR